MMPTRILLAGLSALAITAIGPARADVYYVTYTGTASGTDTSGLFGAAGAVLSGAAFTATYTYDPSQFGSAYTASGSSSAAVQGGSYFGTTDPLLSASLTINGDRFNQSSAYFGEQYLTSQPYIESYAFSSGSNLLKLSGTVSGSVALSLTASQSFAFSGSDGYLDYNGEQISLTESYVTITDGPPTPLPEPASFTLLAGAAGMFAGAFGIRRIASPPLA